MQTKLYQNFTKKTTPPLKFLTSNFLNKTTFKELTNKKSKKTQNILAFSLIELSIVLIIIGLLVAGVTGGASLIESAKIRSIINTFQDTERQIYIFRVAKDRLPGDCNNDNSFICNFPSPYDGSNAKYGIPNKISAPFVDLYLAGISEFQPINTDKIIARDQNGILDNSINAVPTLLNNTNYPITITLAAGSSNIEHFRYNTNPNRVTVEFSSYTEPFSAEFSKKIDLKFDDGQYNLGVIRSACSKEDLINLFIEPYNTATLCYKVVYQTNIEQ